MRSIHLGKKIGMPLIQFLVKTLKLSFIRKQFSMICIIVYERLFPGKAKGDCSCRSDILKKENCWYKVRALSIIHISFFFAESRLCTTPSKYLSVQSLEYKHYIKMCEIYSKLIFIVNLEDTSRICLVFLLLNLKR